jgi:Ca-activated chloride channel family protein
MKATRTIQRTGWLFAGSAAMLLIVACSGVIDTPERGATAGAEGDDDVIVSANGAIQEVEQTAQARADTIIVTGSRIQGSGFTAPNSGPVGFGAGGQAAYPVAGVAPSFALLQSQLAQTGALSGVTPGEEVWIIAQPAPTDEMLAAAQEEALGSGVMLARFDPTAVDDPALPPVPIREIPLPLMHTAVDAKITAYVGTVDVTQQFENPYDEKIEAVYLFPLPEKAAVSEFVMTIGERRIRGILRVKEEAEAIYRQARSQGLQASLLTQHRPNVFEQKVANIEPGKQIDVNIRYYQTLAYRDGWYSFVFPTVVGPRYNPPASNDPLLAVPQIDQSSLPDAAIRYLTPNTRSGHDLSIAVELDPGVEIEQIDSSHELSMETVSDNVVRVQLVDGAMLPNKDFLLSFRVAGDRIKSNLLTYVDEDSDDGYFTLMLYPPADLDQLQRQPLELVFVLDSSGSMNGAPIEQAKAAILAALDRLEPDDTFQIIRFSDTAGRFGSRPVAANDANIQAARRYVRSLSGSGGTQMIEGIRAALNFPHDDNRLRFVTFLTDGFIGNEVEILAAIDEGLDASRIFSFGVGSAPNRYLLERMAGIGRGAVAYLSLDDSGSKVMGAFFDRIAHPAMIDVEIDWGRMQVADVYPSRLPDLFVGRPIVVTGRFEGDAGDVRMAGRAANERVRVRLVHDNNAPQHEFLPNLWARLRIADLNDRLAVNPQSGELLGEQIRQTALAYSLMSDYTSFIAVDASEITEGGYGTTVYQGVPVPEGVRYDTAVIR